MEIPSAIKKRLEEIRVQNNPAGVNIADLKRQQDFHEKCITFSGRVLSIVSVDFVSEKCVRATFWEKITLNSSTTLFYLTDSAENRILIQYPSDLDVFIGDEVTVTGFFHGHNISNKKTAETKTIISQYEEPYVSAIIVQNKTKGKTELIST